MSGTPTVRGLTIDSVELLYSDPIYEVSLSWDDGVWEYFAVERNSGDGYVELDGNVSGTIYSDVTPAPDDTYYYRVRGWVTETGWGGYSNVVVAPIWHSSASDTVTDSDIAEIAGDGADWSEKTETAVATDSVIDAPDYYETISDTVSPTDQVMHVQLEQLELGRFIGNKNGELFLYSSDYHSDDGATIPAWWESKDVDMDDQYPQFVGKFKYLHGVKLRYIDLDEHQVTIYVSTDGGTTWADNTKTIGTGSGIPKEKIFNFWVHGRTFMTRVAHSSTDKDFQWTDIELQFEPAGDYFEVV
jgi:hypothetical protein